MYFEYLIHFAVMLIIGTLFCLGLFMSSRGETEVAPDGSKVDLWAMILYPMTKFLCRSFTYKVYYGNDKLVLLKRTIEIDFEDHVYLFKSAEVGYDFIKSIKKHYSQWDELLPMIEHKYGIKTTRTIDGKIFFWKEYQKFVLPSILFKPIIGCYKCYASVWGTIIFSLGTSFAVRVGYLELDYTILIPMWIIYCFSLVTLNCMVYKIVKD